MTSPSSAYAAFYTSAPALQIGEAVPVIAVPSAAATLPGIADGA